MTEILSHGIAEAAFSAVADAFRANFRLGLENGAGVCVYHHGRPVVELWGGVSDITNGRLWRRETLAVLASPTKALAAGALFVLLERGVIDLDAPIAAYWPEFAAAGKEKVTIRMLLAHRTGVVALDATPITYRKLRALSSVTVDLAGTRPEWPPGTAHGYHATTFGHMVSELVRRTTDLTVGQFVAREIARPLALDSYIGLPEHLLPCLARTVVSTAEELMSGGAADGDSPLVTALRDPGSLTFRVTIGSMALDGDIACEEKRVLLENPSYDGVSTAASLARYFAALIGEVDGVRLVGPALLEQIRTVHSSGTCRSLLLPTSWGLGVMVPDGPLFPADAGLAAAFGLSGASGSFAFADPEHDLAFAYVPNGGSRTIDRIDPRARRLVTAVYRSVGVATG